MSRYSERTAARQAALHHHLPAAVASQPAGRAWIRTQVGVFTAAAEVEVTLVLARDLYAARSGRGRLHPQLGGEVAHGAGDGGRALLFLDPDGTLMATRATGICLIAHEVAHIPGRRQGHGPAFFRRVQQLLDDVGPRATSSAGLVIGAVRPG